MLAERAVLVERLSAAVSVHRPAGAVHETLAAGVPLDEPAADLGVDVQRVRRRHLAAGDQGGAGVEDEVGVGQPIDVVGGQVEADRDDAGRLQFGFGARS